MEETRNAYRILVENLLGKRPHGRPRRILEDDVTMDLRLIRMGSGWN
jgi:hypothetical protein